MKKFILACIALLILLGGGGAVMVWQSFVTVTEDGVEYAKSHDQEACLHESLQRLAWCGGLRCEVKTVTFAHICFQGAQTTESLCDSVPSSVLQIAGWAASECAGKDLPPQACERIHVQAAKACFVNRLVGDSRTENDSNASAQSKNKLPAKADYLGIIPDIQGRVTQVKFFESGDDVPDREQRSYAREFVAAQSRYINWELEFEFPELKSATQFDIKAVYYWPDGTLMGEPLHKASLEAGWVFSWQSYGWGWPNTGEWPIGEYRVEFFVGAHKIAASTFMMR